jgi:hypothetical protein
MKAVNTGLTVQVSLGSSSESSQSTVRETQAQGSNLTSNGDINLTATGSGTKDASGKAADGSLNVTGSSVSGQNVNLTVAKDINLQSAANTSQSSSTSDSSSAAIGASFAVGTKGNLTGTGIFASGSRGSDNGNETVVTHTNTTVTAQNNLKSASGNDTNLNGAQVSGNKVTMNVGGNLNLASQQDTDNYTDQNSSSGFNIGTNMASSASESKGNTNSTYASVTTQTGINAGQGGFNINVGGNTDLKGAVISSQATPDKNTISTGTLSFSNINNNAQYSASSSGIDYSWNNGPLKGKDGKVITDSKTGKPLDNPANGLSISPGMPVSGNAGSTTQSAISAGTIQVRSDPNMNLSQLSRNANNALNALGKIFDKKTVQEKQQLVSLFGQLAYEEVGDIAVRARIKALSDAFVAKTAKNKDAYNKDMALAASWDEGGANKILLHGVVGGIMSDIGGNGFAVGATGAGLNEAIQGELAKIKDAGVHEVASALIGAVAAKAIGGNAQVGASVAVSATKYNWLSHKQQERLAEKLKNATSLDQILEILEEYQKISQFNRDSGLDPDHPGQLCDPSAYNEAIEPELLSVLKSMQSSGIPGLPGIRYMVTSGGLNYNLGEAINYLSNVITLRNLGAEGFADTKISESILQNFRTSFTVGQVSAPGLGAGATFDVAVGTTSGATALLRGVSKIGVCAIGQTAYDVYTDSKKYSGRNLSIAAAIDAGGATVAVVGATAVASVGATIGAPVFVIVVGGVVVGYLVNKAQSYIKHQYLH